MKCVLGNLHKYEFVKFFRKSFQEKFLFSVSNTNGVMGDKTRSFRFYICNACLIIFFF